MEIDVKTTARIIAVLENQKKMYEMTLKDPKCNGLQNKGVKMLLKEVESLIEQLNI